jgi:hypothetical protein
MGFYALFLISEYQGGGGWSKKKVKYDTTGVLRPTRPIFWGYNPVCKVTPVIIIIKPRVG